MTSSGAATERLFIVGCARTGSTLVQHILNRSPDVSLAPETHHFKRSRRLQLRRRLAAATSFRDVRTVIELLYAPDSESIRGGWAWLRRNVELDEFSERFAATDRSEHSLFDLLMTLYAERQRGTVPRVLGEKTPEHFLHLPDLLAWYPAARVIHTFRDPRAIYVSELRRRRQGRWGIKAAIPALPDAVTDPLLPLPQLVHTTVRWSQAVRVDRTIGSALGQRYLRLRYEDLVADPQPRVRQICEFVGIDYSDELLDVGITGSSYSPSRHAGRGIDATTAERWRDHIGPLAAHWFSMVFGSRLRAYDYRI